MTDFVGSLGDMPSLFKSNFIVYKPYIYLLNPILKAYLYHFAYC